MDAWLALLLGVALTTGVFALLVYFYPKLKTEEQGYPLEAQIEEALLPLVFEAICSAYRMSEQAVDDVGARIRGLDKKKIADSIYRMLPDKVGDYDLTLVKNIIPSRGEASHRIIPWAKSSKRTKLVLCVCLFGDALPLLAWLAPLQE